MIHDGRPLAIKPKRGDKIRACPLTFRAMLFMGSDGDLFCRRTPVNECIIIFRLMARAEHAR